MSIQGIVVVVVVLFLLSLYENGDMSEHFGMFKATSRRRSSWKYMDQEIRFTVN